MRANLIIYFILLCSSIGFAQTDSITLAQQRILRERLIQIQKWEDQLETARESGDLYNEMTGLMDLIRFQLKESYDFMSSYENALYLEKLVNENPESRASKEISEILFKEIGSMMQSQGNFDASIPYFNKSIEASKLNEDKSLYFDSRVRLVHSYSETGNRQKAFDIYQLTEKEAIKNKDSLLLTRLYASLSITYIRESNYHESLKYAKKSIYQKAPKNSLAFRNMLVAQSLIALNKPDSALTYAETSLKIASENHLTKVNEEIHHVLWETYAALKNYEKAFYHYDQFFKEQQKHFSFQNAILIGSLNAQKELERTNLQQALSEEKLSNQRIILWFIIGALIILTTGIIFIFNRLKFIRKQNIIIEQEKLRAEQSEKYKEQFLANMSHEIRTPMHAISGMVNSLRRQKHPTSQTAFLDAMKISADNLLVILNDVLDISKIESGSLDIAQVNMNPSEIINHVLNIFQYKAEEKGLELKVNIAQDFPKTILGDPGRFNQVLMNLVSNAIKFTESGYIDIGLSHHNNTLKVTVKDTGSGIPEAQRKTIFESFKQGNNVIKGKHGGTGLGLAISKQLLELQNGKIWLESELGKGSTFFFELALIVITDAQEPQTTYTETQLKALGKQLEGLNILIAEDNEFNIMVVKDDLQWYIPNVNLTFVENGKLAVEKFKEESFDTILMDVQMPEMNGYEATRKIRQLESLNKEKIAIQIIAMTASLLKSQIDKCYNAGMNTYIPKPYKPEELVTTIYKQKAFKNKV